MNPLLFLKDNAVFLLGVGVVVVLAVGGTKLQEVRNERHMQKQLEEQVLVGTSTPTAQPTVSAPKETRAVTAPLPPRPSIRVNLREEDDDDE